MKNVVEMIARTNDRKTNGKYARVSQKATMNEEDDENSVDDKGTTGDAEIVVQLEGERNESGQFRSSTNVVSPRMLYFYAVGVTISLVIAILMLIHTSVVGSTSSVTSNRCQDTESATTPSPGSSNKYPNLATTTPYPSFEELTTTLSPRTDTTFAVTTEPSMRCEAHSHRISTLPGLTGGRPSSCQYAGLLSAGSKRSMFYWLVEHSEGYENKPLLVWFNGGPMCSSLTGLFTEHGPFVVTDDPTSSDGALVENPHSWHHTANVLYVESPAKVGFGVDTTGQAPSDSNFASSTLAFLERFWEEHPRFANSDVWLSGESYAGHYVTVLASLMLSKKSTSAVSAKLVGFMLGNAVTDDRWEYDGGSNYRTLYKHDFISDDTYASIDEHCAPSCNPWSADFTRSCNACNHATKKADSEYGGSSRISDYDLYGDTCSSSRRRETVALESHRRRLSLSFARERRDGEGGGLDRDDFSAQQSVLSTLGRRERVLIGGDEFRPCSSANYALSNPCIENMLTTYLRRSDVRAAIHATASKYRWEFCGSNSNYKYEPSVLHLYRDQLLSSDLKILIFSGNIDDSVPTDGTRSWLRQLRAEGKLTYKSHGTWKPWLVDNQVAGYVETYNEGLTFATVRGAGHMVPATQPKRAFEMAKRFVVGGSLT